MHTNSTLYTRISPQWLNELRQLSPNAPWEVARELVSRQVLTLCLDSGIVSPLQLHWVMCVCVFRCNLLLHFWQNDQGLLCATAITRGWNRHQIRFSTQTNSGEENSPAAPAGAIPFDHESSALTNKLSWLPSLCYNHCGSVPKVLRKCHCGTVKSHAGSFLLFFLFCLIVKVFNLFQLQKQSWCMHCWFLVYNCCCFSLFFQK